MLSGAGISTESGIPDYRGPESIKTPRNPIRYQQFVKQEHFRRRYWARSFRGWSNVHRAKPNAGHKALVQLENTGKILGIITQNVDGLHQAAGSHNILDLHGNLAGVRCLECKTLEPRQTLQARMLKINPKFQAHQTDIAPDGDAEIPQNLINDFVIPECLACGAVLKPDVVFFGENVPKERVAKAWDMLSAADVLLVVGSSLSVLSGYRFVVRAVEDAKPVAIVNQGETRADLDVSLKVNGRLGLVLPALAKALC